MQIQSNMYLPSAWSVVYGHLNMFFHANPAVACIAASLEGLFSCLRAGSFSVVLLLAAMPKGTWWKCSGCPLAEECKPVPFKKCAGSWESVVLLALKIGIAIVW